MDKGKLILTLLKIVIVMSIGALVILGLMWIETEQELEDIPERKIYTIETKTKVASKVVTNEMIPMAAELPEVEEALPINDKDLEEMARVVMSESSRCCYLAKLMVAVTMVNRLEDGFWGDTMHEVLNYEGQYSHRDNGEVTDECREAVREAIETYKAFPEDLLYFRDSHYHSIGYPYMEVDNLYFSTTKDYKAVQ